MSVKVKVNVDWSKLEAMDSKIKDRIRLGVNRLSLYGQSRAMTYSPVKTGHLRRSIHQIRRGSYGYGYKTNIIYAPIQEYGGTIKPKKAKVLKFRIGNKWVSAKQVKLIGRYYMKRSVEDVKQNANSIMRRAMKS